MDDDDDDVCVGYYTLLYLDKWLQRVPSLYSHSQRGWQSGQSFPRKAVIRELKRSNKMTCVAFFVCGEPGAGWTISQPN